MLGGINLKASEYNLSKFEFLNIRNLDFDVPGALQKRPGSTQAISANTSGPISSMHEFVRLDGASTIVVASDTALFHMNAGALSLIDTGWSNGQPPDMLTFVNKEWIANGSKFYGWSGVGSTMRAVGLPCPPTLLFSKHRADAILGVTTFPIGGATMVLYANSGGSFFARSVFAAYSYIRDDGYFGPCDFFSNSRNLFSGSAANGSAEYFFPNQTNFVGGLTIPSGYGISGIALWIAVDSFTLGQSLIGIPNIGTKPAGNLSWLNPLPFAAFSQGVGANFEGASANSYTGWAGFPSITLLPGGNASRFWLYTIIPGASLFLESAGGQNNQLLNGAGLTFWAARFDLAPGNLDNPTAPTFGSYTGLPSSGAAFTGVPFCFWNTNTPKYIEVNQNSMFMSGFSGNPSNVWFSELGTPENIQPENFFEVRTNDGDRVYAIKAYNNQLIVLKQNSFHRVIGDSPENFELIELSTEYGCISNASVVEYQEKLMWLDQKGIVEFNGAGWNIKSNPVEDIFRRMNLDVAKEKAVGVHHLYRNQIWWGIPIDGATKNNITVVYDYLVDAWTFFDGFNPASFTFAKGNLSKPTVFRGDYSGMVYFHGESFFGDNGTGISCVMTPHWDKNKENETWIWRRTFLDVATASGLTGQITGKVYSNYNLSTIQGTFAMYQDAFRSRAEMGVVGKAVTAEFGHHSASLPLLINNYSWAKRFLRNV